MPKRRSLMRPSAFCSSMVVRLTGSGANVPALSSCRSLSKLLSRLTSNRATRHPIHPWRLSASIGFDVVIRLGQPVTMREQRIEVPKTMLGFYCCSLTQFPLQFTDIHRSIPPCSHSGSLRQKRLHAPALPPVRDFLALRGGTSPPRVLRPTCHLPFGLVLFPTRRLVPNDKLGASHFGRCSGSGIGGFVQALSPRLLTALLGIPWKASRVL